MKDDNCKHGSVVCEVCARDEERAANAWERAAYTRALDLLQRLVQDAVPQAGPGYGERDVNRDDLNDVCRAAEQLLYEARGRA